MTYHTPVLLKESIDGLAIRENGRYVDATYGSGGHSQMILNNLGEGLLLAFDQDEEALENKIDDDRLILVNQSFRYLKNFAKLYKLTPLDGVLADLGVSSHQIDTPERGFSTRFSGDLDMRMSKKGKNTAYNVVNHYPTERLERIFRDFGEIKNARKLALEIDNWRVQCPFKTTEDLKKATESCASKGRENQYLARVFQAIRIEVNEEIEVLKELLMQSAEMLETGGRLVVISYHSLEDRLVKNYMKSGNFEGEIQKDFYGNPQVKFKMINRKPIVPDEKEIEENSRARSAKLRIAEKV